MGLPYTSGVCVKWHNYFRNNLAFLKKKVYLLTLFLCCAASLLLHGAFSSCREWGLFLSCSAWASPGVGFSWCRGQALGCSVVVSLAAPQEMESSQRRDQTRVPSIGRWILNHCTSREVLAIFYIKHTSAL